MKPIFTKQQQSMADTITPIGCFLNLRDKYSGVALFESSDYASKANSKSFICAEPLATFTSENNQISVREGKKLPRVEQLNNRSGDFVPAFNKFRNSYTFLNKQCEQLNGFFGLIGYDAIPNFETLKFKEKTRFTDLPEVSFSLYKYVVVFDNFTNTVELLMNSFEDDFADFVPFVNTVFNAKIHQFTFAADETVESNETDSSFAAKVKQSKDYIRRGEAFQLVVSRAFSQVYSGEEFEVYRQLRALNPSPYMFYLELDKAKLFGASPEAQLRVNEGTAEIHPIAGTVKRTMDPAKDRALTNELIADKKENAEHTMLVDLARNDLNVNCEGVTVTNFKEVQTFSHVIHLVSKVIGNLENADCMDVFSNSFPAGTLSGAPKYRAMELIDEMEVDNRGYYGGAVGHISPGGDLNMAIIIRSCLAYKNYLHYQAGAGVVYDSVPEKEVQEVYNKIGAVQKAITRANQNLKQENHESITHR